MRLDFLTARGNPAKSSLAACITVLGPFLVNFNTWGLILSFGVFETYYLEELLPTYSPSTIAWIGTLSIFLLLLCGVVSGPLFDQGYQRALLISGHILFLLGVFMLSLSKHFYSVFLSQGVCFGIGSGLLFAASLTGVSRTFTKHRAVAIGVAICGASVGGIVFSVMLQQLLPHLGFGWTMRVIGFMMMGTSVITLLIMLPEPVIKAPKRRALLDTKALRDGPFMSYSIGSLFVLFGYYLPFIYTPTVVAKCGGNDNLQLNILAIMNGAAAVGHVLPAFAADKFGALKSVVIAQVCAGIVLFCWPAVSTVPGVIVWAIFWGFISGVLIAMLGAVVPELSPPRERLGTWMGMAWAISAIGFLIGAPIGGAVVEHGSLVGMQCLAGAVMMLGAGLCILAGFWRQHNRSKQPLGQHLNQQTEPKPELDRDSMSDDTASKPERKNESDRDSFSTAA